jgi:tetratricopeptide (TPR) repeat protein
MQLMGSASVHEAKVLCTSLCRANPADAEAWYMLGAIHGQLGEFQQAESCCNKALALAPRHPGLHYNLAVAQMNLNRPDRAVTSLKHAISLHPQYAEAYLELGNAWRLLGDSERAIDSYQHAIRLRTDLAMAHFNLAGLYRDLERWEEAECGYRQVIRLQPDFERAYSEIANILICGFKYDKVIELLQPAAERLPEAVDIGFKLGVAWQENGDAGEARAAYERVIAMAPDHADAKVGLAGVLGLMGEYGRAMALLSPLIESGGASPSAVITYATIARRFGREDDAIRLLEAYLETGDLSDSTRSKLCFVLARLLDRREEYEAAFRYAEIGNRCHHAHYDPEYYGRIVSALEQTYSREFMESTQRATIDTGKPVFIIGMPRSGTSLVEQILASHPDVFGGGELHSMNRLVAKLPETLGVTTPYPDCARELRQPVLNTLAGGYIEDLIRRSGGGTLVTDKMPNNFWHLGLIDLLFPGAHIIHCLRDPMDTCLSCWFLSFGGDHPYAYDFPSLGDYYRKYLRLMRHWREVIRLPVFDVRYEELVTDQESMTRRLLEFCGLPWNDACLKFHESGRTVSTASSDQVRKPLYKSSIGRWKHYATHLGELESALRN